MEERHTVWRCCAHSTGDRRRTGDPQRLPLRGLGGAIPLRARACHARQLVPLQPAPCGLDLQERGISL